MRGTAVDSIVVDGVPVCLCLCGRSVLVGCANTTICEYEHTPKVTVQGVPRLLR